MSRLRIPNHDSMLLAGSCFDEPEPSPANWESARNQINNDPRRMLDFLSDCDDNDVYALHLRDSNETFREAFEVSQMGAVEVTAIEIMREEMTRNRHEARGFE